MPYGEEIIALGGRTANNGYLADDVRQGFTGYERDIESELDFAEARYYNPMHGRFTSPDDFRNDTEPDDPQSWNLYNYVRNKPLVFIDPTGKMGDYYTEYGQWVGTDGRKDDKVYVATVKSTSVDSNGTRHWQLENVRQLSITHTEFQKRAATVYGESSAFRLPVSTDLANEMAAIAYVHTRNPVAYGADSDQAKAFMNTTPEGRTGKMQLANFAIINQLTGGPDPSNGATAWDGREQALIPESEKRRSVPAKEYGGKSGTWEVHKNTIGWRIQDDHYATWKANVGRGFRAPQVSPSLKGKIGYVSTAVYGNTIFWKRQ
ncbi:MAG: RHS repeat-associated core domain-containing protein [Pyrinomonadaceae bacterium]